MMKFSIGIGLDALNVRCTGPESGHVTLYCDRVFVLAFMSLSSSAPLRNDETAPKRRRTSSINIGSSMGHTSPLIPSHPAPAQELPKRGARACTTCRKGKNRCEGEVSRQSLTTVHRSVLLIMSRLSRPARCSFRPLADVVLTTGYLVPMKNPRKSLRRGCLALASSKRTHHTSIFS